MPSAIFITSGGYDPDKGKLVKDPYLGDVPSIGACRPDLRKQLRPGDHIFVISGKLRHGKNEPGLPQYVMGGFEAAERLHACEAFIRFPEQRLHRDELGRLVGNVIVDDFGHQSPLDRHRVKTIEARFENYIVGRNPVYLQTASQIALGREETVAALCDILKKNGARPIDLVCRAGARLSDTQVDQLRQWLLSIQRRRPAAENSQTEPSRKVTKK